MSITLQEMQRQLHAYAMAEMRNRGLEEAARIILERAAHRRFRDKDRYDAARDAEAIRAVKTDPSEHLSDWWDDRQARPEVSVTNGVRASEGKS